MNLLDKKSKFWDCLSDDIKGLLEDGELLVNQAKDIPHKVSDYSYLVFPFSKAYEGFLKKLFLDLGLIKEDEFYGDDIRIGRILNPHFIHEHENVFDKITTTADDGKDFAEKLWKMWRRGRNKVFHYFPHNFRKLRYKEAVKLVEEVVNVMEDASRSCYEK